MHYIAATLGVVAAIGAEAAQGEQVPRAGEEDLMAFTEEQVRLLGAAFDHVWARLSDLQDRCDAETERTDALGLVLADQGLITPDQWETAIAQLALRTGMEAQMLSRSRPAGITDEEITRRILSGDAEAFERVRDAETQ